jgi:hypothetical protein
MLLIGARCTDAYGPCMWLLRFRPVSHIMTKQQLVEGRLAAFEIEVPLVGSH